jgi:hypothetical protein
MTRHITKKGYKTSHEKRNLLIVTALFSLGILYRAIFNTAKLILSMNPKDENKQNKIDVIES